MAQSDSSLYSVMDSKSLTGQSRLEPSELREKTSSLLQEDITASSKDRDSPLTHDRSEFSPVPKDTPRTPSRERGGLGSSPDVKDQTSTLTKPSQDEELMEVVEKSEDSSNQIPPHLSPELKEMTGSNCESSPELDERPAVSQTFEQSQLQTTSEAAVPAVASTWSGPHFSPEHKELSNSPVRENSFGSPLGFRSSGPFAEMNTAFSPGGKDLNEPFPPQTETDPTLDVKEQSTRSSRHSSSELSPDTGEKAGISSNQSVSSPVHDPMPRTPSRERSSSASPELKDGLPRTPSRRSRSGSSPGLRDGSGTPSRQSLSGSSPGTKDIPRTPSRGRSECDSSPEPKALPQTPRPRSRSPLSPELNKCLTPQRERSGSESSVEQKTVARTPVGQRSQSESSQEPDGKPSASQERSESDSSPDSKAKARMPLRQRSHSGSSSPEVDSKSRPSPGHSQSGSSPEVKDKPRAAPRAQSGSDSSPEPKVPNSRTLPRRSRSGSSSKGRGLSPEGSSSSESSRSS